MENFDLKRFYKILFSTSGYVGATQLYSIVLTAMGSLLPEGSLSIFNYVRKLGEKAKNILIAPIITVFFSKFARKAFTSKSKINTYQIKNEHRLSELGYLQTQSGYSLVPKALASSQELD